MTDLLFKLNVDGEERLIYFGPEEDAIKLFHEELRNLNYIYRAAELIQISKNDLRESVPERVCAFWRNE